MGTFMKGQRERGASHYDDCVGQEGGSKHSHSGAMYSAVVSLTAVGNYQAYHRRNWHRV